MRLNYLFFSAFFLLIFIFFLFFFFLSIFANEIFIYLDSSQLQSLYAVVYVHICISNINGVNYMYIYIYIVLVEEVVRQVYHNLI